MTQWGQIISFDTFDIFAVAFFLTSPLYECLAMGLLKPQCEMDISIFLWLTWHHYFTYRKIFAQKLHKAAIGSRWQYCTINFYIKFWGCHDLWGQHDIGYLQTASGHICASWPQRLDLGTDTESKFIGDSNRSQFGELSKSALQIWLPSGSWQTTDWLLTDWLTPNRLWTDSH